ncbi:MAG TPA: OsmC family peroxiredoxin [Chloroflexota bacterium]
MAERRASVIWEGSLTKGHGTVSSGSGVLHNSPVTWASRVEREDGMTSPEELLAAAQAECYAMVLSNLLGKQGKEPERLDVTAICTVERQDGGLKITTMKLQAKGRVHDMDQEAFTRLAEEGEKNCPVSNALRGNVQISVEAKLETAASTPR